jgi:hypothetical protein
MRKASRKAKMRSHCESAGVTLCKGREFLLLEAMVWRSVVVVVNSRFLICHHDTRAYVRMCVGGWIV